MTSDSTVTPRLANALAVILPTSGQTLLLRVALLSSERARRAFKAWQAGVRDPTATLARHPGGGKLLAPLLRGALQNSDADVDDRLLTYLRTAAVREELRAKEYRQICAEALHVLAEAGLPVVLLKGAALAETVYPDPHLRHSRDIDLLVREPDLGRASSILSRLNFRVMQQAGAPNGIQSYLVHGSGLPLILHATLFQFPHYNSTLSDVWERSERQVVLDAPIRVLSPADQLLHVCAHASTGWHRENLLWVCDAWLLIARRAELDWEILVDRARDTHVALPLYVTLRYLAGELEAPIPETVLRRLGAHAAEQGAVAREVALFGGWAGPGIKMVRVIRSADTWRERAFVVRWRLAPSPTALLSVGLIRARWQWPRFYVSRPFRFVWRRVRILLVGRALPESRALTRAQR